MGCSWFGRVSVHGTSGNQCKAHPGLPTWYWHSRFQKRRADQTKRDQAHLSVGRSPYSRGSGQKTTTGFFGKKSIKNLNVKPLSFWEDICTPRWVVKKYLKSVWSPPIRTFPAWWNMENPLSFWEDTGAQQCADIIKMFSIVCEAHQTYITY